jgi:hypothetical protein
MDDDVFVLCDGWWMDVRISIREVGCLLYVNTSFLGHR